MVVRGLVERDVELVAENKVLKGDELTEFAAYYNDHRPHRTLSLQSPVRTRDEGTVRWSRRPCWVVCTMPTPVRREFGMTLCRPTPSGRHT
jgi:hypothetical protein